MDSDDIGYVLASRDPRWAWREDMDALQPRSIHLPVEMSNQSDKPTGTLSDYDYRKMRKSPILGPDTTTQKDDMVNLPLERLLRSMGLDVHIRPWEDGEAQQPSLGGPNGLGATEPAGLEEAS